MEPVVTNSLTPEAELSGWKMIAAHLSVSVREAQTWEKDGMPVRRMPGKKSRVWADRAELDAWKQQIFAMGKPAEPVSSAAVEPAFPAQLEAEGPEPTVQPRRWSRRSLLSVVAGSVATATVGALAWMNRPQSRGPARAGLVGNTLCAWDNLGRLRWKYEFPPSLRVRYTGLGMLRFADRQVQTVDLYGTNARQVIVAAAFWKDSEPPGGDELYCFSSEGKVLWTYRPEINLTFGSGRFSGPWNFEDVLITTGPAGKTIWVAVHHWDLRPAFLAALDPAGRVALKFVSAGHIYALHQHSNESGSYILAGGINNEYTAASLAVLRADGPPSRSPQTARTRFECVDGPTGDPDRYFVFPPTELNALSGRPYNWATQIIAAYPSVVVDVGETLAFGGNTTGANAMYTFTRAIEPKEVAFDDSFGVFHRNFEADGRLKHPLSQCPHLTQPTQIRRWEKATGWTTINVPPSTSVRPDVHQG